MSKDIKFKLTNETKVNAWGITLFRIEATVDITERGVKKGDKGGFVESTHLSNGNARVSGNAWVFGNAEVSGDARVSLKKKYTNGLFLSSSDNTIVPTIIDQSKEKDFDSGTDYKNLLVVGDYDIEDVDPQVETIEIDGKKYRKADVENRLKELETLE